TSSDEDNQTVNHHKAIFYQIKQVDILLENMKYLDRLSYDVQQKKHRQQINP
ncbi:Hypothetical predicted protein, partial [Podarcis lilfordi]